MAGNAQRFLNITDLWAKLFATGKHIRQMPEGRNVGESQIEVKIKRMAESAPSSGKCVSHGISCDLTWRTRNHRGASFRFAVVSCGSRYQANRTLYSGPSLRDERWKSPPKLPTVLIRIAILGASLKKESTSRLRSQRIRSTQPHISQ